MTGLSYMAPAWQTLAMTRPDLSPIAVALSSSGDWQKAQKQRYRLHFLHLTMAVSRSDGRGA